MTPLIVTEGTQDAELLYWVLDAERPLGLKIQPAGGKSSAESLARSALMRRRSPVALVVDADTFDSRRVDEQKRFIKSLLPHELAEMHCLVQVVPALQVLLFRQPTALSLALGTPPSEDDLREGLYRPREMLRELGRRHFGDDRWGILMPRLRSQSAVELRNEPEMQQLIAFIREAPAIRGEATLP
ncbi:MAG: hypothetical protein HY791_03935 [Deltaproteobacteria bacterium]|nr:hypothetical protein [Deltaproteobacteria bacterium]